MQFLEITEKEYTKFWEESNQRSFLSSPKISSLRKELNWETYFVGVKDNSKLLGAALIYARKTKLNTKEFYSPRGLLVDYKDEKLLTYFVNNLKEFIKKHNGYILRIDPYVIYKERDIDGNIVEGGLDNSKVVENLSKLGFKKASNPEQVTWMFSLNLEGKTEEEIFKEMRPNVRNYIRKAEKIGIDVRELSKEELPKFQSIMEETGARKNFKVRKLSYFEKMYDLFHDTNEVKYFITELNLDKYISNLQKEIDEKEESLTKLSDAKYNEGKKKNIESEIENLNKKIEEAETIKKDKKTNIISLSGSMFMLIQPEVIYLSSGNYEEYMKFNGQYLIQWHLIKYGIKNGFKKHNFYGIPENINTHPKDYGIYEFKRGFNGYVEELIGEYYLPINKLKYTIFNIIHKLKK